MASSSLPRAHEVLPVHDDPALFRLEAGGGLLRVDLAGQCQEASGIMPADLIRRLLALAGEVHAEKTATRFESEEGRIIVDRKHLMSPRK